MSNHEPPETGGPELRLLADVRRRYAEPDAETVDRLRHAVLNATRQGTAPPRRARGPWRIATPVATGVVAVAVLVGAGTLLAGQHGDRPAARAGAGTGTVTPGAPLVGDGADARQVMALAAQVTRTTPQLTAGAGQYVYRQTTSRNLGSYTFPAGTVNVFGSQRRQDWLDPRQGLGDVRFISTDAIIAPVTARDAQLAAQVGFDLHKPPQTTDSAHASGKGTASAPPSAPGLRYPTPRYLDSLPTDPVKLLAVIRRQAASESNAKWSTDRTAFDMVSDLIAWGDPLLSPELRAALYRAVALMPGVSRVPEKSAPDGGPDGVVIGFTEGGTREEIIFDPTSLRPLGTRDIALKAADGIPAGTVTSTASFQFAIVDGVGRTG